VKPVIKGDIFEATLGPRNKKMAKRIKYRFRKLKVSEQGVHFSKLMLEKCGEVKMRPVCDHPKYCKDNPNSIYIGQAGHLAYPKGREEKYVPEGFLEIADQWKGLCSFTGKQGAGKALCNIPTKTHSWKRPQEDGADSFICGKMLGIVLKFEKTLGPRNDVPSRKYQFRVTSTEERKGNFNEVMVTECKKHGMKPVCDFGKWCDDKSVFLGQEKHLAHPATRKKSKYFPDGWDSDLASAFDGLCVYTGKEGGGKAMCNVPLKTHKWQELGDSTNSFMCVKVLETIKPKLKTFKAELEQFDHIPKRMYDFEVAKISKYSGGTFSELMINACKEIGMKPVCDHPQYCANDAKSVFLGQQRHIAYPPQRDNPAYFPKGWEKIKHKWEGLCSYTNTNGAGKALCNNPSKTHSWKIPSDTANTFMCARIEKEFPYDKSKPVESTKKGCDEQLRDKNDEGYRGCQDTTISGYTCQKWTSQSPHAHQEATPATTPGRGLGDHNYCRNADDSSTIWCFTTNPEKRIEQCLPKEKFGDYTMLQGDCAKSKKIKSFPQCSVSCCKQQCDRDQNCNGFSYNDATDTCIIRKEACKHQPGKCDPKKKMNGGFCFYQKGKAKMKKFDYHQLRGDCANGKLIRTHKDIDRKDCQKKCTINDECAGFSYNKDKMFCDLRTKACDHRRGDCLVKQCFWVKGTPKKKAERVKRNLAPGCKKMEFGYKYEGEALTKIDRVASGIKCNAHCFENAKCKAWTWGKTKGHPNANMCFLLKNMKSKKKNPDYDSGLPDRGDENDNDDKEPKVVKAGKVAFIDGYARFRKAQRLERMQVIRQIKRMHQLVRNRELEKLRAQQTLDRLKQLRKLQLKQRKERKIYRLRMSGKMPMPGDRKRKFKLSGKKSDKKMKIPKKLSEMKKKLKDLKKKKKKVKKERKKLNKLEKEKNTEKRNVVLQSLEKGAVKGGLALNSLEKGAVKSDRNSDFEQFKKELFDDYDDSGKIAKSGSKKIKKEMKKALRKMRPSKLQETDTASPVLRKEMEKIFKKGLKKSLGFKSDGGGSFSSSLYGGIWGDDYSNSRKTSRSRSPRRSRRVGSGSSVSIGFDYSRRKI